MFENRISTSLLVSAIFCFVAPSSGFAQNANELFRQVLPGVIEGIIRSQRPTAEGRQPQAAPSPTVQRPTEPAMSRDDKRQVQAALNQLGYKVGAEDGIIGRLTRRGIQGWQSAYGYQATGYLTGQQLDELRAVRPAIATIAPAPVVVPVTPAPVVVPVPTPLAAALTTQQVTELQIYLQTLGFYQGQVDGQMGQGTVTAANAFLQAKGFAPQAVVTENTLNLSRNEFLQPSAPVTAVARGNGTSVQPAPALAQAPAPIVAAPAQVAAPQPEVSSVDPKYAFAFVPPVIEREDVPSAGSNELYDEFGFRIAYAILESSYQNQKYGYILVEDVRSDGPASRAGISTGDVIMRIKGSSRITYIKGAYLLGISLEDVTSAMLGILRGDGFDLSGQIVPLDQLVAFRKVNYNDAVPTRSFTFGGDEIERHVGFVMHGMTVQEVYPNSPADIAGLKVGDQFSIGFGMLASNWSSDEIMRGLSSQLRRYASGGYLVETWFVRNGKTVKLDFPPIALGESFSTASLTASEKLAFDKLPKDLSTFLSYVYLGDYDAAKPFQMAIFDKYFKGTAVALVSGAFGTSDKFRENYERSRGLGIFSQYILIKSNEIGLCSEPGIPMRVEQKRYRVWVDGYGVETSGRKEIEPNVYEFTVPARWSEHLKKNAPMGEARQWARGVEDFVHASGGCNGTILKQLEDNMLTYLTLK